jgi:DNA repair protein RecN (Recombination protein N)
LRPLAKVASGGELSRIGLALQVIASQANAAGTLIFDEVDVGIGGRVAEIVGRMLRELGGAARCCASPICRRWRRRPTGNGRSPRKRARGRRPRRSRVLDREARIGEIARMLGGEKITETTRRHAAEMLGSG